MGWPFFLVTASRFGPGAFWNHDLFWDVELAVDLAVRGLGRRGLSDAQGGARGGRQDDGGELVGGEALADRGPGGVDALIEQRLLDGDQQGVPCKPPGPFTPNASSTAPRNPPRFPKPPGSTHPPLPQQEKRVSK